MRKHKTTGADNSTTQQPNKLHELRNALLKGASTQSAQGAKKSIFFRDLSNKFKPDAFAEGLLISCFPDWLSDRLRRQVVDALRGLDEAMAIEVADDMMDCWTYGVRHYIGILYIDNMLNSLYNKIAFCAEQQEVKLLKHF